MKGAKYMLFKNRRNKPSFSVKVVQDATFLDVLKVLLLVAAVAIGGLHYYQKNMSEGGGGNGVVFKNMSKTYSNMESSFNSVMINKEQEKIDSGTEIVDNTGKHNVFYVEYNGTLMASEVVYLKQKIDAIILKSNPEDEVLIKITSPGGAVSGYGLVASQINRLKVAGIKVTAVVDTVAASGGYMAAVVADEIVAAPFAMVGSIGVVANVMIYEDFLKNFGVESRVYTAGESKRSVVPTRIPTPEEEAKLKKQLEDIHTNFKNHVLGYRPDVDESKVFTGEAFLAADALNLGLVDRIGTSDELLLDMYKDGQRIIKVQFVVQEDFSSSMAKEVSAAFVDAIKTEIFSNNIIYQ
jgi:serine protease SohB